jgi:outer membrane protein OmpA-like peptidoglycan-associated protein
MAAEHEGSGLASSLTDLMTSLAVIFILLLVAMLNNQRNQTADAKNVVLSKLTAALEKLIKDQGIVVMSDPKDPLVLLVIVPEDLLKFEKGKSDIPAPGYEFLRTFVPKFIPTACSAEIRQGISSIVVEGHASSEGQESKNLGLSQLRSMAVINQSLLVLDSSGRPDAPEDHKCFLSLISATGRGSADPVKKNGVEDFSHSRRVVFKIRIKSIEERKEIVVEAGLNSPEPTQR